MSKCLHKLILRAILFLIIIISSITSTYSCSTPVFRYALEMWPAYFYSIEIIHDGSLTSSQKQALKFLQDATSSDASINLKIIETVRNNAKNPEGLQARLH